MKECREALKPAFQDLPDTASFKILAIEWIRLRAIRAKKLARKF
jgi:hypothetical protein